MIVFASFCCAGPLKASEEIRKPQFSGSFYPARPEELLRQVKGFLGQAPEVSLQGELFGLVVPHAGYIYSGPTAALAYRVLQGKPVSTVILLGRSHRARFSGAIIDDRKAWETPLGQVQLDAELFSILYQQPHFHVNRFWLDQEHGLEVQLPFLQIVAGKAKIFPVLLGEASEENLKAIVSSLAGLRQRRKDIVFVASSDMSHYHPLKEAEKIDRCCLNLLERKDLKGLREALEKGQVELCGDAAVLTLCMLAREQKSWQVKVLGYDTSAAASGDRTRVVGYGALALTVSTMRATPGGKNMLNEQQRKKLLQLARETILSHLKGEKLPPIETDDPVLREKRGVFVTLRKNEHLRGCIGTIMPVYPLVEAVQKMAIESATGDPRFSPVTLSEMNQIKVEISVLTVPRRVKNAEEIELGRDGVIVKKGFRQGVFLPQVAEETGWSKEEFLSNLCYQKAGLSPEAWKEKETELYTFQAEVFSE